MKKFLFLVLVLVFLENTLAAMDRPRERSQSNPEFIVDMWRIREAKSPHLQPAAGEQPVEGDKGASRGQGNGPPAKVREQQRLQALVKELVELKATHAHTQEQLKLLKQEKEQKALDKKVREAETSQEILQTVFDAILQEHSSLAEQIASQSEEETLGKNKIDSFIAPLLKQQQELLETAGGDDNKAYENIEKLGGLILTLQTSFLELEEKLDGLYSGGGYITSKRLETVEKSLGVIAIILNTIALITDIIAVSIPGSALVTIAISGGIVLSGGTVVLIAGIASAVLIATYFLVQHIKQRIRKKEKAKEKVAAKAIQKEVQLVKALSSSLLSKIYTLVEAIEKNYSKVEVVQSAPINQYVSEVIPAEVVQHVEVENVVTEKVQEKQWVHAR